MFFYMGDKDSKKFKGVFLIFELEDELAFDVNNRVIIRSGNMKIIHRF